MYFRIKNTRFQGLTPFMTPFMTPFRFSNPPDRARQQKNAPAPKKPCQGGMENYARGKWKSQ